MKKLIKSTVLLATGLATSLMFCFSSQAAIITFNGNHFNDSGNTTIDITAGLEWLDVNNQVERTFCDWIIDSGTNPFSSNPDHYCNSYTNYDGLNLIEDDMWRIATHDDFSSLVDNWFGIPESVAFLPLTVGQTFIDTLSAQSILVGDYFRPNYANIINGTEYNIQAIGGGVSVANNRNSVTRTVYNGGVNNVNSLGAFFVRDAQASPPSSQVPEPSSLFLLALGLMAVMGRRSSSQRSLSIRNIQSQS